MESIIKMYITLLPVIFAGIFNMLFVKTKFYKKYRKPIDCGKNIFGNNKTWIGALSMILFTTLFQLLFSFTFLNKYNYIYENNDNNIFFNIFVGFLFGLAYILFELPNSFVKRRLNIEPGKTAGILSYIVDQIDSIIGVTLILSFFTKIDFFTFLLYILLGAVTHSVVNLVLYLLKIRKNV